MDIRRLRIGMRVRWKDPDAGKCSGDGSVVSYCEDDDSVMIRKDDGGEVEVLARELEEIGDGRYYIAVSEWNYPCESGREILGDFDTFGEAMDRCRSEAEGEIENFEHVVGDCLDPAETDEGGMIITSKMGLDDFYFATKIIDMTPSCVIKTFSGDRMLGKVRYIAGRVRIERTSRGSVIANVDNAYTYAKALADIQDVLTKREGKCMTKNDLSVLLSDNYGNVPGDSQVMVRAHDGVLRPAYLIERREGGKSILVIGPESEL